jgi:hypothetical protein
MSLRRLIAVAGTALMLSSGLIASAPASTGSALSASSSPATASGGYDEDNPKTWGATRAPNQVLRAGCHRYRYHYRIDVPDWAAEIFLVNPNGRAIVNDIALEATEPSKGWRRWSTEICRASTTYGRHKIRMKITWTPDADDPTDDNIDGFVKPSFFRFTRP